MGNWEKEHLLSQEQNLCSHLETQKFDGSVRVQKTHNVGAASEILSRKTTSKQSDGVFSF